MKLVEVRLAQSVKAVIPNRGFGYLPDAIKAMVNRYKFIEFPTEPHQLFPADPNGSINFRHGRIDLNGRTIVIGWLQLFQTGISISTETNTSDSDLVLNDLLQWAESNFNIEFEEIRPIGHASQLYIQFDLMLADFFPALRTVGDTIGRKIDDFYPVKPPYELTSVIFHFDQTLHPSLAPAAVKIEPRVGVPFAQRIYYSEAPLSTADHLELLANFERICLESSC